MRNLYESVKVLKDIDKLIKLIEHHFLFNGSRINWCQTEMHYHKKSNKESLFADTKEFIVELREKYLKDNVNVIYLGDNLTEYGYQFDLGDIDQHIDYLLGIPQHHYFVPKDVNWCICISFESYLDFGFSVLSEPKIGG